jgi:diguanylate cyclase (GGDEF)-like protein
MSRRPIWLLDRTDFFDQLRRAMARNEGVRDGLAILAVSLDPFILASTSDAWDRQEDIRLVSAGRLVGCLHRSSPATRISGDQFLVLAEGTGGVDGATFLAEQLLMAVRWPEMLQAEARCVTASIGVAFQEPHTSVELLQNRADMAMYSARGNGGNRYEVYLESRLAAADASRTG